MSTSELPRVKSLHGVLIFMAVVILAIVLRDLVLPFVQN